MKLLILVLCLLSERFLIHSFSSFRFSWFDKWYGMLKPVLDKSKWFRSPVNMLAGIIVPAVIIVALIYLVLHNILFGLIGFVLNLLIFFICLGPQNPFYPLSVRDADASVVADSGDYLAQVNHQMFAVIFWYVIGGPIVLLAYKLVSMAQSVEPVHVLSTKLTNLLEWVPARMTAFLYLLVGNFQCGLISFRQFFLAEPLANNELLYECGLRAVRSDGQDEVPMPVAENLVEHATIVLLVFIALFTLGAWV